MRLGARFDPVRDALIAEVMGGPVGHIRVFWDRQREGTKRAVATLGLPLGLRRIDPASSGTP